MQQYLQNKKGLVQGVFDKVYNKYDLMNDVMSFGAHRRWKKNLINMMNPSKNQNLIDVACGTGDIAKLFLESVNYNAHITCVDPNKGMITKGKEKLKQYNLYGSVASKSKDPKQMSDQLEKLNSLFKSGAITEAEFKKAKNRILNN